MIKRWLAAMMFVAVIGGSFGSAATPQPALAATCTHSFLTFPAWYDGVIDNKTCELKSPDQFGTKGTSGAPNNDGLSIYIWTIVLNIIEIALQVVGYASVGFIIYGGFIYMIGAGASDKIVGARKTILNAVIGLVISFFSVVIVNVVADRIK